MLISQVRLQRVKTSEATGHRMSPASNRWKKMRDKWGTNHIFKVPFRKKTLLRLSLCWTSSSWLLWSPLFACLPKLEPPCRAQSTLRPIRDIFNLAGLRSLASVKKEAWLIRLTAPLCVSRRNDIAGEFILIEGCFFLSSLICPPDNWGVTMHLCALLRKRVFALLLSFGLTPKVPKEKKKFNDWLYDYNL